MGKKRVAKAKKSPPVLSPRMTALSKLTPYQKNPRVIPDTAVKAVAASLKRFGWKQAIVADPKGVIVAGETRYKAAVSLGWKTAPVVTIPASQARAFRVIDNRTSELTSWDTDLLPDALSGLDDLEIFSFDDISPPAATGGKTDPDDIPDAPEPRTKLGDVWTLGDHRLMCGDCTQADDVARLLEGARPTLAVTSPPYNLMNTVGAFPKRGGSWKTAKIQHGYPGHSDNMPHAKYVEWQRACLTLMMESIADDGAIFYNHKWRVQEGLFQDRADIMSWFPVRQIIIWNRGGSINFSDSFFQVNYEVIYLIAKPKFKLAPKASHVGCVWDMGSQKNSEHPAPFPVELPERCIKSVLPGSVYDPFVGSGTTIIAAEREHRRCYAMEIAPEYVDLAVKRWEDFTGKKATRERKRHG